MPVIQQKLRAMFLRGDWKVMRRVNYFSVDDVYFKAARRPRVFDFSARNVGPKQ